MLMVLTVPVKLLPPISLCSLLEAWQLRQWSLALFVEQLLDLEGASWLYQGKTPLQTGVCRVVPAAPGFTALAAGFISQNHSLRPGRAF